LGAHTAASAVPGLAILTGVFLPAPPPRGFATLIYFADGGGHFFKNVIYILP
jgi:hypothetical protein